VTALCGGGTSSSKPDFSRFISISTGGVGYLLNNVGLAWAVPFGAVIGLVNYDLNHFCDTDPPPMPTITAEDCVNILNPLGGSSYIVAQQKFQDLIANYAWPQYCQCDTGAQPGTPAPIAAPTNLPQVDPVTPVTPDTSIATPCHTYDTISYGFRNQAFPTLDPYPTYQLYSGFNLHVEWDTLTNDPYPAVTINMTQLDTNLTVIVSEPLQVNQFGSTRDYFFRLDSRAQWVYVRLQNPSNTDNEHDIHMTMQMFCGGAQPGAPANVGCCPPDPSVLALLANVQSLVTLIQRQAVPFAYIQSTAHSGLSGVGHLDVNGLLGVKVQLDSVGTSIGLELGDPNEMYDAGWITWGNADGSTKREWITHSPFVSLPAEAGQFTRLGYTLGDGVTATITELVREP
jgi:hypothetical protein